MSVESPTRLAPLAQSIDNLPVLSRPNSQSPLPPMAIPTNASAATSTSTSAPEIHYVQPSSITLSPSVDAISAVTHLSPSSDVLAGVAGSVDLAASINADVEPDPQILEALRSKDRIYVLKLGESMESLINDRRIKIDLNPSTSYQRLLVHRCSAYYKLVPETDPTTKNILIYFRSESRIPARRISELVPAEESSQPAFQIMRRIDRSRGRQHSQPGSTAGEDADLSDVEPSETGSIGGRSNATGSSMKRFKTIEEREAAYLEARSRIFMGFEEKDKEKDKDMSANSSTFSLVSGSGSNSGGRSSIGDIDDSGSSAATESEWSGPATRDKRDSRRGVSVGSSSRSLRSSGASYNANGSGSSRNSRATSPSFTYASLYEPPPPTSYDPTQYNNPQAPPPGYIAHYIYPPYTPGPSQPYLGAFSFYPPYGYQPPPAHHSDPVTPAAGEPMYPTPQPAPQPVPFAPPYMWPHSPPPGQPPLPPHLPQHPPLNRTPNNSDTSSPTQVQNVQQYPYMQAAPHYNPYAPQGYYQPPPFQPVPQISSPVQQMQGQVFHSGDMSRPSSMDASVNTNGVDMNNHSRASSRNSTNGQYGGMNGGNRRGAPRARGNWSYGPGAGMAGYTYNIGGPGNGMGNNDIVGPRLSSAMRRTSTASSASGSAGARTPGDETSSTTSSSTTSSSSRRTFTSTSTSSKHPLPARPDWAVGLKPQHPRHHDHSNPNSRTMSPARIGGQAHLAQQHATHPNLHSNDFPPLSSGPEKRQPVVGGAWTNATISRVMMPGPQGNVNPQGSALVHYPNSHTTPSPNATPNLRLDEQDHAFERPPPKGNSELFNPKAVPRSASTSTPNSVRTERDRFEVKEKEGKIRQKGEGMANAILVDKVGAMSLDDRGGEAECTAAGGARPSPAVSPSMGDPGSIGNAISS